MSRFKDKLIKAAAYQDGSLGELMGLRDSGFTTCIWQKNPVACGKCVGMHGMTWDISAFISGLMHDAPLFERSHVNCRCVVLVQNPATGEEVQVAAY